MNDTAQLKQGLYKILETLFFKLQNLKSQLEIFFQTRQPAQEEVLAYQNINDFLQALLAISVDPTCKKLFEYSNLFGQLSQNMFVLKDADTHAFLLETIAFINKHQAVIFGQTEAVAVMEPKPSLKNEASTAEVEFVQKEPEAEIEENELECEDGYESDEDEEEAPVKEALPAIRSTTENLREFTEEDVALQAAILASMTEYKEILCKEDDELNQILTKPLRKCDVSGTADQMADLIDSLGLLAEKSSKVKEIPAQKPEENKTFKP